MLKTRGGGLKTPTAIDRRPVFQGSWAAVEGGRERSEKLKIHKNLRETYTFEVCEGSGEGQVEAKMGPRGALKWPSWGHVGLNLAS